MIYQVTLKFSNHIGRVCEDRHLLSESLKEFNCSSVHEDSKSDNNDKDGVITPAYIRYIIVVFIINTSTLHLHTLPVILTNCSLHNELVAFVFL